MAAFFRVVSFNGHYFAASLIYLGLSFSLLMALPDIVAYAQNVGGIPACTHTVMQDQEGTLVPVTLPGCADGYACCETSGTCEIIE